MKVYLQDLRTPDHWVHRNPQLIRLTGKHPFNCEAPLTALFNSVRRSYWELSYLSVCPRRSCVEIIHSYGRTACDASLVIN